MRILIAAVAVMVLAGCSTPTMQEIRQAGPANIYISSKQDGALSKCILFAWQDSSLSGGGMPIGMQPNLDGGTSVYAGNREYFADVRATKSGSEIKYYEIANTWGSKILKPEIERCL